MVSLSFAAVRRLHRWSIGSWISGQITVSPEPKVCAFERRMIFLLPSCVQLSNFLASRHSNLVALRTPQRTVTGFECLGCVGACCKNHLVKTLHSISWPLLSIWTADDWGLVEDLQEPDDSPHPKSLGFVWKLSISSIVEIIIFPMLSGPFEIMYRYPHFDINIMYIYIYVLDRDRFSTNHINLFISTNTTDLFYWFSFAPIWPYTR